MGSIFLCAFHVLYAAAAATAHASYCQGSDTTSWIIQVLPEQCAVTANNHEAVPLK